MIMLNLVTFDLNKAFFLEKTSENVLKKFGKIHRKTPVSESLVPATLFKQRLRHWRYFVNSAKFLEKPFL